MTASCRHMYKLDDGDSYPSQCFPIRTLLHQRKEGAGHWIVAHRDTLEHTHRNVHANKQPQHRVKSRACESCLKKHRGTECRPNSPASSAGKVLDTPFLMQLHCVDEPSELCSVNISGQGLNSVKAEDLKDFDSVAYINASDNSLSLGFFSSFSSVRELDLSLNGLSDMTFSAEDFPHLEIFDLSYNGVSASAIVSIGLLPRLRVLHLSGNRLRCLPADLASPPSLPADLASPPPSAPPPSCHTAHIPAKGGGSLFGCLEVLMLDDNKLSSDVFSSLANLRRLRYLNLQGNHISEVPYLQQKKAGCKQQRAKEQDHAHNKSSPSDELSLTGTPEIVEEEALLPAALFPRLSEVVVHSNPLTTHTSGDPPLLTRLLQERLGVRITRKKPPAVPRSSTLTLRFDPKRTVDKAVPEMPAFRETLLLRSPPFGDQSFPEDKQDVCEDYDESAAGRQASPAKAGETEETVETSAPKYEANESGIHETRDDAQPFFATQPTDFLDCELGLTAEEAQRRLVGEAESEADAIPEKCEKKGYKILMNAKADPDVIEATGIQPTVRMLKHALNNPVVYRDSRPKLNSLQSPYREQQKKIKPLPALCRSMTKRHENVEEMLQEMKESKTFIRGVPLGRVLGDRGPDNHLYEEAESLLRDLMEKYKMVHEKRIEQATRLESEAMKED